MRTFLLIYLDEKMTRKMQLFKKNDTFDTRKSGRQIDASLDVAKLSLLLANNTRLRYNVKVNKHIN